MHKVIDVNLRNLIWDWLSRPAVDSNTRIYNLLALARCRRVSCSNCSWSCLARKLKFYYDFTSLGGFQQCYGRGFSTLTGRWNISHAQSVKYFCSAIDSESTKNITFVLGSACQILNVSIIISHLSILYIWIVFFFNIWIIIFHINDLPRCYGPYFLVSLIHCPLVLLWYTNKYIPDVE